MRLSTSIFLVLDSLSAATFFRQMSSSVSVSLLSLSTESSVLARKKKRAEGGWERRQSIKTNWRRGMRVRYQKTGWWGMNEIEYQTCCGLWGQGLYHSLLLKQQPPQRAPGSQPIWATALFTICWRKQLGLSLPLSLSYTLTQSLLTSYLVRENRACSLLSP